MADRKITDLTALAAGSQATGDLLTIVDVSESAAADKNKSITVENLFKGIPGDVGIGVSAPTHLVDARTASGNAQIHLRSGGDLAQLLLISNDTSGTSQINFGDNDANNVGIIRYAHSDNSLRMLVNSSERMRISSGGSVGIGTTSPQAPFTISNGGVEGIEAGYSSGTSTNFIQSYNRSTSAFIQFDVIGNPLVFKTGSGATERMRIDGDGRLLVGTASTIFNNTDAKVQIQGGTGGTLVLGRDDNSVSAGNGIGLIRFYGNDGGSYQECARIAANADGSHADGDKPTRLEFLTTADNGSSPTEQLRINSDGDLLFKQEAGSNYPEQQLKWSNDNTTANGFFISQDGDRNGKIFHQQGLDILFGTNNAERMRIDNSGRVGISTSSPSVKLHVAHGTDQNAGTQKDIARFVASTNSPTNSGGLTIGAVWHNTSVNDRIAYLQSEQGLDPGNTARRLVLNPDGGNVGIGTTSPTQKFTVNNGSDNSDVAVFTGGDNNRGLKISTAVNGGVNDSTVVFDAQTSSTGQFTFETAGNERMRITKDGDVLINTTTSSIVDEGHEFRNSNFAAHTVAAGVVLRVNRLTNDGEVVQIFQDSTQEGSISVSGTTVSYNGAHLSRWSQLASGAARTEILRGSVLSNLDEMCEWAYDAQDAVLYTEEDELPEGVSVGDVKRPAVAAGTENNEQLNRMKVSDVEGDRNVAGVFQDWDDDDDTYTNDFYCAMTGDFVIRIAQGTTVARGDLLMSAGDGTAKPQDDDIVRSKTIAKVTSTTVSTTYADGSYCVPCVLMAC